MFKKIILACALVILAACQPAPTGSMEIKNAWARPAKTGDNSAAYFIVENGTGKEDVLLSASSDIASATELHESTMTGDMAQMQMQTQVAVPVGITEFKEGNLHVMFAALTRDLNVGDTFTLTLKFKNAGEKTVTVTVKE